jgi:hypothetical protein
MQEQVAQLLPKRAQGRPIECVAPHAMAGIAAKPGVTGSPIPAATLTYVEARVAGTVTRKI